MFLYLIANITDCKTVESNDCCIISYDDTVSEKSTSLLSFT